MAPTVHVILGPARCGKTHALLGQYRHALRDASPHFGRALWLAPTSRAASAVRQQLLQDGLVACLDPGVTTFDAFTRRTLAALANPPRATSPFQERILLRRVIAAAASGGQLKYLAAMAHRTSFVDLVFEHIQELKRYGVSPAAFARSSGFRGEPKQQRELAVLYDAYEKLLAAHNLADEEGRHFAARDALQNNLMLYSDLRLVIADGFTDFTHPQLEILAELAARGGRLLVSLPAEEHRSAGRDDLFSKTKDTLAELRLHFDRLAIEQLPCRATDWPALDHVAHHLFEHPRDIPAPPPAVEESLDRLEIVAAAGVHDEILELARRIKRSLTSAISPLSPGDVVVVFRNLREAAPRIREVFDEFGIPYSLEAARPLASTTVMRVLLDLLRLDAEDWPYRRAVSIVTNNQLAVADRPQRAAAEWLLRELQIDRGREHLLSRIAQLNQPPAGELASASGRRRTAQTSLPFLQTLAAALDALPASATPADWIVAIETLAASLLLRCLTPATAHPEDRAAWQAISEHLERLAQLSEWQNEPPSALPRAEFLDVLVDLAQRESLPRESDDTGRVRILSAQTARTVSAKHVFLAGMSEQAFPSPERAGNLYSSADYRAFAAAADQRRAEAQLAPLSRSQEEMLLFYDVLTRASERLTISYPALDQKAQALPPSPYVTEVERAVAPAKIPRHEALRPAPIPTGDLPLSPRDWRVQAVYDGLESDASLMSGLFRENAPAAGSLESALRIVAARSRRDGFGPAEGLLESEAARARLARRFGSEHLWSPSQWETYAVCPYRFFVEQVLRLQPLGELVLETDHMRRGTLVHRALAEFHRSAATLFGSAAQLSRQELSKFVAEFVNIVDALTRATPYSGVEAALVELDRLQIIKWAPRYYDEHGKYDAAWALETPLSPTYLEWRFGPPRDGEKEFEDRRSTNEPFVLSFGKEQIRVTGRIDRIDVGAAGATPVFNVIDYKSGKATGLKRKDIESGLRLQPALYVLAAQQLLFEEGDAVPVFAGYWSLSDGVKLRGSLPFGEVTAGGAELSTVWNDELRPHVESLVGQFVTDIRGGNFAVSSRDEHCTSRCDFATVCRIAQVRSLGKQFFPAEDNT